MKNSSSILKKLKEAFNVFASIFLVAHSIQWVSNTFLHMPSFQDGVFVNSVFAFLIFITIDFFKKRNSNSTNPDDKQKTQFNVEAKRNKQVIFVLY